MDSRKKKKRNVIKNKSENSCLKFSERDFEKHDKENNSSTGIIMEHKKVNERQINLFLFCKIIDKYFTLRKG